MKKELYLLALIAAFVVLAFYFPAQKLQARNNTPDENMRIFNSTFSVIEYRDGPRAIPNPDPGLAPWYPLPDPRSLATEWKLSGNIELGMRSDGVVVWRKKEK